MGERCGIRFFFSFCLSQEAGSQLGYENLMYLKQPVSQTSWGALPSLRSRARSTTLCLSFELDVRMSRKDGTASWVRTKDLRLHKPAL
jgi:hypothetical protein